MTAKTITGWKPSELFLSLVCSKFMQDYRSMKCPDRIVRFGSDVMESVGENCDGELCIAESEREGTRAETRIGLSAKRTSPFKSAGVGGSSVDYWQSRSADEGCKTTVYPLHSHLSPSLPLPCVTVCLLIPIQLYHWSKIICLPKG